MLNYEKLSASELLEHFISRAEHPVLTASFSVNSVILLYFALKIKPDIEVVFIDTGMLFEETYSFAEFLRNRWKINLKVVKPEISIEKQAEIYGDNLWKKDPDKCCFLRKVKPLESYFETQKCDLWIAGLRRDQSKTRENIEKVEIHTLPSGRKITKIHPLADWNRKKSGTLFMKTTFSTTLFTIKAFQVLDVFNVPNFHLPLMNVLEDGKEKRKQSAEFIHLHRK